MAVNFLQIRVDTTQAVKDFKAVADRLAQNGERAGNNLGQGIAEGLERSLYQIEYQFRRMELMGEDVQPLHFDEHGVERQRQALIGLIDTYHNYSQALQANEERRANLRSAMALMEGQEESGVYQAMAEEMEEADAQAVALTEEIRALHQAITSTEEGQQMFDQSLEYMAHATEQTAEAENHQNRELTTTNRLMDRTSRLAGIVGGAFTKLKNIAGGVFKKLTSGAKSTNNTFLSGLKNVLKYALGIGTVAVAVNKLKGAVKEGFGHLSSYSSDVRKQLMTVTSALGQFKNQIGASFQPILAYVAPILKNLISILNQATVAITNFFATLTGQSYFYKANDDVTKLANGFGSATKKAKELKTATSGLDELNVINADDEDAGGGGGAGGTGTFEKVLTQASDFANLLKDMIKAGDWEGVGGALADKLANLLRNIDWNSIRKKARKFGENLSAFIKGFFDPKYGLGEEIGKALAQSINTAFEFVDGLVADRQMWKNIGISFARGLDAFIDTIDVDLIADTINNLFLGAIEGVRSFFEEAKAKDTFHKLGLKIGELIKEIKWEEILLGLGDIILDAIIAVIDVVKGLNDSEAFKRIGEVIGNVLSDKEFWEKFFNTVGDAIVEAIEAVCQIWDGVFDGHPIAETVAKAIAVAFGATKTISILNKGISLMFGSTAVEGSVTAGATTLGATFATAFVASLVTAVIGFEVGKLLGEAMFPEDAEWYQNFHWFGDGGGFDSLGALFTEGGLRASAEAYQQSLDTIAQSYANLSQEQIAFADSMTGIIPWNAQDYADQINAVTLALGEYRNGMSLTEMGYASWTEYADAMLEKMAEEGVQLGSNADLYTNYFGLIDAGVITINEQETSLANMVTISDKYADAIKDASASVGEMDDAVRKFNTTDWGAYYQNQATSIGDVSTSADNASVSMDNMGTAMNNINTTDWGEYYQKQATSIDEVTVSASGLADELPEVGGGFEDVSSTLSDFSATNDFALISIQGTVDEMAEMTVMLEDIKPVLDDFNTAWEDTFTNVHDSTISTMEELKSGMDEILNGIITSVEVACNSIIAGVNGVIKALNALSIDIPDITDPSTGKTFKGQHISFNIPELASVAIPRLAQGAVIPANREFMAVLGDQHNGTNVEAPLDTIKQALIEALDDSAFLSYLASISDYTRATSEKDMTVRIGDRDIARANIRGQKQMGRTLITSV